jgi:cation diffusion facilitator family transporter
VVARQSRPDLLATAPRPQSAAARAGDVSRVLAVVLALNLSVAMAKILYGLFSGAVSILSDGFHSLADASGNIVALVGVRLSHQPADDAHPYGHRKFETLASGAIFVFLLLVLVQVVRTAIMRLHGGTPLTIGADAFVLMIATLGVNIFVERYEAAAARRLGSELLLADAMHTRSDVQTSLTVLVALAGVRLGWPMLDPLAGLVVAGFIGHAGYQVAKEASRILADHAVIDEAHIRAVVMDVPEVVGCHEIRTRGSADHVFLDLHVWFPKDMRLDDAHRLSHLAKDRLMAHFPALRDVIIHIEPPPLKK